VIDVIFNADDFGLTAGVTRAIVEASEHGVLRSTTAMVCRDNDAIIQAWAPRMQGDIGLHLQLTDGVPCLPAQRVPSLVDEQGRFPRSRERIGKIAAAELEAEWHAQCARLRDLGIAPSHIDTHHHVHWRDDVLSVYIALARSLGLPARSGPPHVTAALRAADVRCPALCDTTLGDGASVSASRLLRLVQKDAAIYAGEVTEIMCHPGYVDDDLRRVSTLVAERAVELEVLCSRQLHEGLRAIGARCTSMKAL
jgi:predicted glycoside hydrolase/deacetylase ChbG (UPF0249 family)